jgi:hypothetical protein
MNKKMLKAVAGASLAILVIAVCAQVWVSAQSKSGEFGQNEQRLVGSWDIKITIRDCASGAALVSFPTMMTFNQGGTMQETANDATPLLRLPGHGIWSHQAGPIYSRAFHFFRFDPDGTFAGTTKIKGRMELDRQAATITGSSTFEFLDPNGSVTASGCATEDGTRFR